jgi:aerobic-type carbon monoxide dehydrogenase small subunit (CoxS/CutS family)/CO/xanthine dehydrogenase FAD-binding subunit
MLARGIRSYHRPTTLDEALSLARQGIVPLAGGTRLLAAAHDLPNVLDLSALGLSRLSLEDGDLVLGALTPLQDIVDSPLAHQATAGLLPQACRAQHASPLLRGMATVGGEAIHGHLDSEVVAALLALNAVFVLAGGEDPPESPALRFLRDPREDLAGGRLLVSIFIPGAPDGAALERVAALPSAPPMLSVLATITFAGEKVTRARVALTGLETRPARVLEAEARLEGTGAEPAAVERCIEQIVARAPFRDDAHAPAAYRKRIAAVLTRRALARALGRARGKEATEPAPRGRPQHHGRLQSPLPYFTSGRIDILVNGVRRQIDAEARATLLDVLRREGFWGVKHGCETGECGACAVLLDGRPVASCITLAARAGGRTVTTVEGLGTPGALHPVQEAFVATGAVQCGYCTPAMEVCAKALLDVTPRPTEAEVRDALAGCLCRCTGYVKPVEAVLQAAQALANGAAAAEEPRG